MLVLTLATSVESKHSGCALLVIRASGGRSAVWSLLPRTYVCAVLVERDASLLLQLCPGGHAATTLQLCVIYSHEVGSRAVFALDVDAEGPGADRAGDQVSHQQPRPQHRQTAG